MTCQAGKQSARMPEFVVFATVPISKYCLWICNTTRIKENSVCNFCVSWQQIAMRWKHNEPLCLPLPHHIGSSCKFHLHFTFAHFSHTCFLVFCVFHCKNTIFGSCSEKMTSNVWNYLLTNNLRDRGANRDVGSVKKHVKVGKIVTI